MHYTHVNVMHCETYCVFWVYMVYMLSVLWLPRVQREQLAAIFQLLRENKQTFGEVSEGELEDQFRLYSTWGPQHYNNPPPHSLWTICHWDLWALLKDCSIWWVPCVRKRLQKDMQSRNRTILDAHRCPYVHSAPSTGKLQVMWN